MRTHIHIARKTWEGRAGGHKNLGWAWLEPTQPLFPCGWRRPKGCPHPCHVLQEAGWRVLVISVDKMAGFIFWEVVPALITHSLRQANRFRSFYFNYFGQFTVQLQLLQFQVDNSCLLSFFRTCARKSHVIPGTSAFLSAAELLLGQGAGASVFRLASAWAFLCYLWNQPRAASSSSFISQRTQTDNILVTWPWPLSTFVKAPSEVRPSVCKQDVIKAGNWQRLTGGQCGAGGTRAVRCPPALCCRCCRGNWCPLVEGSALNSD